jgi:hypothetical protein
MKRREDGGDKEAEALVDKYCKFKLRLYENLPKPPSDVL